MIIKKARAEHSNVQILLGEILSEYGKKIFIVEEN